MVFGYLVINFSECGIINANSCCPNVFQFIFEIFVLDAQLVFGWSLFFWDQILFNWLSSSDTCPELGSRSFVLVVQCEYKILIFFLYQNQKIYVVIYSQSSTLKSHLVVNSLDIYALK